MLLLKTGISKVNQIPERKVRENVQVREKVIVIIASFKTKSQIYENL